MNGPASIVIGSALVLMVLIWSCTEMSRDCAKSGGRWDANTMKCESK